MINFPRIVISIGDIQITLKDIVIDTPDDPHVIPVAAADLSDLAWPDGITEEAMAKAENMVRFVAAHQWLHYPLALSLN